MTQALEGEIDKVLMKDVLEIVPDKEPVHYNRPFLVKKASGVWRPFRDLSLLNKYVDLPSFKMETISLVLGLIGKIHLVFSMNLKDAFFQIPIHQHSILYLRFMIKSTIYQFKAPCFGL